MLGLKNLTMERLTTVFMVISAAMMIFALSGSVGSPSTVMLSIWIVAALVLIGVWVAVAVELFKRFFGGQSPSAEDCRNHQHSEGNKRERRSHQPGN